MRRKVKICRVTSQSGRGKRIPISIPIPIWILAGVRRNRRFAMYSFCPMPAKRVMKLRFLCFSALGIGIGSVSVG